MLIVLSHGMAHLVGSVKPRGDRNMSYGLELLDPKHHYRSIKEQRKADFDYCCAYCGCMPSMLTIDHVIPRSQWQAGDPRANDPSNLLPACIDCNQSKGSTALSNWYTKSNSRYTAARWNKILQVLGD